MPFKTRREKIAAAAHRFTFTDTQAVDYPGKETKIEAENKLSQVNTTSGINAHRIEGGYSYVKQELVKIILLTSIIILAQIILLFFLRQN